MEEDRADIRALRAEVLGALLALAPPLDHMTAEGLRRRGLTHARARLIRVIERSGPMMMSDLSRALDVTPRAITALVDGLEADGFVRRCERPHDRRVTVVTLTSAGRRCCREMTAGFARVADELLGTVPSRELATSLRVLGGVRDRLDTRRDA